MPVTTAWPRYLSRVLETYAPMSMPTSAMARTASGCTQVASVPALATSSRSPAKARKNPSAIWLRAELCVQRTRTRGGVASGPGSPSKRDRLVIGLTYADRSVPGEAGPPRPGDDCLRRSSDELAGADRARQQEGRPAGLGDLQSRDAEPIRAGRHAPHGPTARAEGRSGRPGAAEWS